MSTREEKLAELTAEECNGTGEYRDCAVHSAKAQAMASLLLALCSDELTWDAEAELWRSMDAALDRADGMK